MFIECRFLYPDLDLGLQFDVPVLVGTMNFGDIGIHAAFTARVNALPRHIIKTEHHILGRHDNRVAVGRRKNVVRCHHQRARFKLRLDRQGHMYRHLVAIEVGIECRTDQRVKLDRLAFDQYRLKSLDAQPMQRRRSIEHHRVLANHLFEDIPDFRAFAFDQAFRGFDCRRFAAQL